MRPWLLILSCFLFLATQAQLYYQLDSTTLSIDVVLDSSQVNMPWEILWGPDDRLWMTDGQLITRWDPVADQMDTLLTRPYGNGLGMALHPDFPSTPQVFAVFDTSIYYAGGDHCELFRIDYDPVNDVLLNDTMLLSYPHAGEHGGGRLLFDSTDHLLLTTADYWLIDDTLGHKMGKVLRIATDGSVPVDNPTADHTWTRGHRNPQGICSLPNGSIIVSEHGMPNDELNLLSPDANYGWPVWDGTSCTNIYPDSCTSSTFITEDPLATFFYPPSGIEHYPHQAIPEFTDKALTCALWVRGLVVFEFNSSYDQVLQTERYDGGAFNDLSRIRDIAVAPDGSFYLITNDRQDARIRHVKKDMSTEISEILPKRLKLWPNPTSDQVTIQSEANCAEIESYILDQHGRILVRDYVCQDGHVVFDVSNLSAGLYNAFVRTESNRRITSFTVLR